MATARPVLKVALIQPGHRDGEMSALLRDRSQRVKDQVELIVWPESTIGGFSLDLTSFRSEQEVRANSRSPNLQDPRPFPDLGRELLCVGSSFPHQSRTDGPFRNTAYLIDSKEQIIGRYHKRFLMPWSEFVVGQQFVPGLVELLGGREYVAGNSPDPLTLPDGQQLGVLICYEDLLEQPVRETCQAGAQVLINLNNLSTFDGSAGMWQHQQIATFRAIENRRPLLRCGIPGPTTVISATGRIEQQAPARVSATLVADVPLFDIQTFAGSYGQVIAWICPAITLSLLANIFFITTRGAPQSTAEQKQ